MTEKEKDFELIELLRQQEIYALRGGETYRNLLNADIDHLVIFSTEKRGLQCRFFGGELSDYDESNGFCEALDEIGKEYFYYKGPIVAHAPPEVLGFIDSKLEEHKKSIENCESVLKEEVCP